MIQQLKSTLNGISALLVVVQRVWVLLWMQQQGDYKTILFEQYDFAKGTSSRSTKLVHGGVRYLQQGNIKLVMEALKERGLLLKNAPHLVQNQKFVVPNYKWWEGPFMVLV